MKEERPVNPTVNEQDKPLILVADDDITVRMIATECLEQSGYAVAVAENGREAVELYQKLQPQAVMLDVLMPETNGYEACRRIRALPGSENLPILMMTALEDVDSINASYEAGASEFTSKPINWTIEAHRLRSMLRAAEAMKEVYLSRQEWERTFNSLDEIVTIMDTDLMIIQANEAARAAARNPVDTIVGRSCCDIYCSSSGECENCLVREVISTGRKKVVEQVNECLEGTFLVSVFPVFDDTGNLSRIVHMTKDITERQQLEAEVRVSQKMDAVGTLAGGLAHDFNNLLQVIIGYSELVSRSFCPEDKAYQHLETVREAAWRGSEISRQLLSVGRKTESKKEPVQLIPIVESVSKLLERTIPKMIVQQLDLSEDLWPVNADCAQLEQVLMNLAVNAGHAMPTGGKLTFEARNIALGSEYGRIHSDIEPGDYVMLAVTDTGCGMDAETQSHIFEPFFTTRAPDKGTGLGLSMVYGIVKAHEGHLLCYSEVGKGTTFKIYIPAHEGIAEANKSPENDEQTMSGDEIILLVDDEPAIRHVAKKLLNKAGYEVIQASNGQEALDVHANESRAIDLVILDLNMPVMGGLECLDSLQARAPELPVLLASGFACSDESTDRLNDKVHYLSKPYHATELLQKVREMLDGLRDIAA
jgi:signal transduction histidine kinase/DNA-binding response OmpR family regulator